MSIGIKSAKIQNKKSRLIQSDFIEFLVNISGLNFPDRVNDQVHVTNIIKTLGVNYDYIHKH